MVMENPAVWSAVIAVLALILSQLPPLREIIRGLKVRITVPEIFTIIHFLGNIRMYIFLDVHNIGGRFVSISKIDCVIKDAGGSRWNIPAQTYISRQPTSSGQPPQEFLIGWISLKPGEHWSRNVRCFKLLSEAEEEKVNDIISKIRDNITAKLQQRIVQTQALVEADEGIVKEAKDFFEKKFSLSKGNYQLFIAVLSESNPVILSVRGFEFTLFESHIRSLRAITEEYKYGAGIYYPSLDPTKVVWARLRPIPDEQAREAYEKLRSS